MTVLLHEHVRSETPFLANLADVLAFGDAGARRRPRPQAGCHRLTKIPLGDEIEPRPATLLTLSRHEGSWQVPARVWPPRPGSRADEDIRTTQLRHSPQIGGAQRAGVEHTQKSLRK